MRTTHNTVSYLPIEGAIYIYGLVDPRNGAVRYVGKTKNPPKRYAMHLTPGALDKKHHRATWLRKLFSLGLKPEMMILDMVYPPDDDWRAQERKWIARFRSIPGYPELTNSTEGGDGTDGLVLSEEQRKKMSERMIGKKMPPSHGEKIRAALEGFVHSDESRKNMSEGGKRKWKNLTEEEKKKQMQGCRSNRKRKGGNHSKFIGVTLAKGKYWRASAFFDGKTRYIGTFKIEEDAATARDRFVLKHVGEGIPLNFPRSDYE